MTARFQQTHLALPSSRYDKARADFLISFIGNLCHTKGEWYNAPFVLLPWQEEIIRNVFGTIKPDGNRQFTTAYVEIAKKQGKTELGAALALYMLVADGERGAEILSIFRSRDKPRNYLPGGVYHFFFGGSSSGKAVNERIAMQTSAVYSCVRILAEAVAGQYLRVKNHTRRTRSGNEPPPVAHGQNACRQNSRRRTFLRVP